MWLRTTKQLTSFFLFLLLSLSHKTCTLILKWFLPGGEDLPGWRHFWPSLIHDSCPSQSSLGSVSPLHFSQPAIPCKTITHIQSDFPPPQWLKLCKPSINHILAVWERTRQPHIHQLRNSVLTYSTHSQAAAYIKIRCHEETGHSSLVTVLSLMIQYGLAALSFHSLLPTLHTHKIIKPLQRIYRQKLVLVFYPPTNKSQEKQWTTTCNSPPFPKLPTCFQNMSQVYS